MNKHADASDNLATWLAIRFLNPVREFVTKHPDKKSKVKAAAAQFLEQFERQVNSHIKKISHRLTVENQAGADVQTFLESMTPSEQERLKHWFAQNEDFDDKLLPRFAEESAEYNSSWAEKWKDALQKTSQRVVDTVEYRHKTHYYEKVIDADTEKIKYFDSDEEKVRGDLVEAYLGHFRQLTKHSLFGNVE